MSFRTRLTTFFIIIVIGPMLAVGFMTFRLIGASEQGKADARAAGLNGDAASVYNAAQARAEQAATTLAREAGLSSAVASGHLDSARAKLAHLASGAGLVRVILDVGGTALLDRTTAAGAIAPGAAIVPATSTSPQASLIVSDMTATQYVRALTTGNAGVAVVVRQGAETLASNLPAAAGLHLPGLGTTVIKGTSYRTVSTLHRGLGVKPVHVTVLFDLSKTAHSVQAGQLVAAAFIAIFVLIAFGFSVLASRQLQGQLARFLQAARRLGGGDFSAPVPTKGKDEFAALGTEFNLMSSQLERRLGELDRERARLRESIRRIGETFASNLDRPALLELALKTAVDAVDASGGHARVRPAPGHALSGAIVAGELDGFETQIELAEQAALAGGQPADADGGGMYVVAAPLGATAHMHDARGVITVARRERPFEEHDREVLRSLATQATLALENVDLHEQVQRQAVTDELTGLANHRRFQELLSAEMDGVRRYCYPVGLIMLDVDNFTAVNNTYGHPKGDVVLGEIARIVRASSRETDTAARYGGEEMAVILPHTDLNGALTIAERVRGAIESLQVPIGDGRVLRVTASLGVASSLDGNKQALIQAADAALLTAKREGKNRTVSASR